MKGIKKKILFACTLAVGSFTVREIYCMVAYIYNITIKRGNKLFLTKLIDLRRETEAIGEEIACERVKWYDDKKHTEKLIKSFDNTMLYGRIYTQRKSTELWVIVVHGFGTSGEFMDYAGKEFYNIGCNVLICDCRGHGRSDGNFISMGYYDKKDILKWCKDIISFCPNAKICLYGVSMGAASVLMCGGEKDLPDNVFSIIADCSYTSAYDIFKEQMKQFKVPALPILDLVSLLCKIKNGFNFRETSALEAVKKINVPVLFIHGEDDKLVPIWMTESLYKAKKGIKAKFTIKGAAHGVAALRDPVGYWKNVKKFLNRSANNKKA